MESKQIFRKASGVVNKPEKQNDLQKSSLSATRHLQRLVEMLKVAIFVRQVKNPRFTKMQGQVLNSKLFCLPNDNC